MSGAVWIACGAEFVVFVTLLFGAAGTFRWPAAWAFLALLFGAVLILTWRLARDDPALLEQRMKPPLQKDQPLWDKLLLSTFIAAFVGWLFLTGLDAKRFEWSAAPIWLQSIGAIGVVASIWICYRALAANTFAAPVVKIQAERGHRVVSSGPYRIVRHPLYAGALIFLPATALMLGSYYGVAATVVLAAALVARTALEDRELRRRLEGYEDYVRQVPYRLAPFVW